MRNLTVERRKAYAGCLAKISIYIEDPDGDLRISGVQCRLLGKLKNGQKQTFPIGNGQARIFAIFSKLEKELANDSYVIPAGTEDVFVSGQNQLNPALGNPFLFDGVHDELAMESRKKSKGRMMVILCVSIVIGLVVGLNLGKGVARTVKPKTFTESGMSITLTNQFRKIQVEGFTVGFDSKSVGVLVLKEDFTLMEGMKNMTTAAYLDLVIEYNEPDVKKMPETRDGLTSYAYTFYNPEENVTFYYTAYAYKTEDAFWLVQFACDEKKLDDLQDEITQWAGSVTFQ